MRVAVKQEMLAPVVAVPEVFQVVLAVQNKLAHTGAVLRTPNP